MQSPIQKTCVLILSPLTPPPPTGPRRHPEHTGRSAGVQVRQDRSGAGPEGPPVLKEFSLFPVEELRQLEDGAAEGTSSFCSSGGFRTGFI